MDKNEIKKALYKEKPTAVTIRFDVSEKKYMATLSNGRKVYFHIPIPEMGESVFSDIMPAQLLIRWMA